MPSRGALSGRNRWHCVGRQSTLKARTPLRYPDSGRGVHAGQRPSLLVGKGRGRTADLPFFRRWQGVSEGFVEVRKPLKPGFSTSTNLSESERTATKTATTHPSPPRSACSARRFTQSCAAVSRLRPWPTTHRAEFFQLRGVAIPTSCEETRRVHGLDMET